MASNSPTRLHLILLAGGKGLRASTISDAPPKQFQNTARGPLYLVCLKEFLKLQKHPQYPMTSLTITVADDWRDEVGGHLRDLENVSSGVPLKVPWLLASAGVTRTESTWSAICSLQKGHAPPQPNDLVAVHDSARPFASSNLLSTLSFAATRNKAAVPGLPVSDSLVQITSSASGSSEMGEYVDRETIFAVQTPQVFRWDVFASAHSWAAENGKNFTDDGSLLAHKGVRPKVVPGETDNWKVTTPGDSARAMEILGRCAD